MDGTQRDLVKAYLAGNDERAESGFVGSEERWELLRRPIASAIDRDGSFLDIGCANGHLMNSLEKWSSFRLSVHGLDISPELLDLAKKRHPEFEECLYLGDAMDWQPTQRFDFVHTELIYVPPDKRVAYVRRLLDEVVTENGKLIVTNYASRKTLGTQPLVDAAAQLSDWGFEVSGTAVGRDEDRTPLTSVAWIDN